MPRGRPRKQINTTEKQVHDLAGIGCTMNELSAISGVSVDTLERNYADVIEKGRQSSKSSLRRMQWKAAESGNVTMQIWLGKQMLDQRDKQELEHSGEIGLAEIIARARKRVTDATGA